MITVKEFLSAYGLDTHHDQIKLVKHVDHDKRSITKIINDGYFDIYQAEQHEKVKPFDNAEVIVSFIARENNKAEFYGLYKVKGHRQFTKYDLAKMPAYLSEIHLDGKPRINYYLEEIKGFEKLRGRLITQWKSTRGWVQYKDLEVYELLPEVSTIEFPGMQNIILDWDDLCYITAAPREHKEWFTALRSTSGIYRIVDMSSGESYIGSAYGEQGIWGRWSNYAKTGHGGNKLLKNKDHTKFRWSIIRTLSGSISSSEVIKIENIEKEKHGSRVHGLNDN